jgi:hypothetical protein
MKPLIELHRQYDVDVFDVERSEVDGGSIRVYACHKGEYKMTQRLKRLIALEESEKLYDPKTHEQFARRVEEKRRKLFDAVYRHAAKGRKIIGIGAPAKALLLTICIILIAFVLSCFSVYRLHLRHCGLALRAGSGAAIVKKD